MTTYGNSQKCLPTSRLPRQATAISGLAALLTWAAFHPALLRATAPEDQPPPRTVNIETREWADLPDTNLTEYGRAALEIEPDKWKHAVTENYILHFRRITEARKVAREIEFNLWFVARILHAGRDRYARKSHAFIFEDPQEWRKFVVKMDLPDWSSSVAVGDELFLNLRGTGDDGRFDSSTLAHEATHAVVARLYPNQPWPLWLNEGLAEFVSAASVAERKNQTLARHQRSLSHATIPVEELITNTAYPNDPELVTSYYQSSERLVRFLLQYLPEDRFPRFVETLLQNNGNFQKSLLDIYGDHLPAYDDFKKAYSKFDS